MADDGNDPQRRDSGLVFPGLWALVLSLSLVVAIVAGLAMLV